MGFLNDGVGLANPLARERAHASGETWDNGTRALAAQILGYLLSKSTTPCRAPGPPGTAHTAPQTYPRPTSTSHEVAEAVGGSLEDAAEEVWQSWGEPGGHAT